MLVEKVPKDTIEVISVTRAMDVWGEGLFLVQFGHMFKISEDMGKNIPRPPGQSAPKEQGSNVLVLYVNFDEAVPYKVGSKWTLDIKATGELSLKEVKI
jgi:hypothetical protein